MKITPSGVYAILYRHFGPQGWWPVTSKSGKVPEYSPGDYSAKTPAMKFEICAGAILTQNTSWKNAEKAIINLNSARALSAGKLAKMPLNRLAALIRPSGYFNQKAKRLKGFARYVSGKYPGGISQVLAKPLAGAREELLGIKGIGPETADSMLLYAGRRTTFVVDAYTCRLASRMGWVEPRRLAGGNTSFAVNVRRHPERTSARDNERGSSNGGTRGPDYAGVKEFFEKSAPRSFKAYNEFHALIVALGKDYCRKKPVCAGCPLSKGCPKKI